VALGKQRYKMMWTFWKKKVLDPVSLVAPPSYKPPKGTGSRLQ
jgi:hypothetical protein